MIHDSKIIALDIDFHKIKYENIDDINIYRKTIQKISGDQNLVIFSNENLNDIKQILEDWKIRNGYLISNSGSVIYDIGAKRSLFQMQINPSDVKVVAHIATLKDLLLIVNNKESESFTYKISDWTERILQNKFSNNDNLPIKIIENWKEFLSLIDKNEINSLEICFPDIRNDSMEDVFNNFVSRINNLVDLKVIICEKSVFVTPKHASRLNALAKIAKIIGIDMLHNTLYVGVSSFLRGMIDYTYITACNHRVLNYCWDSKEENKNKSPTIFLDMEANSWATWLNDNDYLWAYDPRNDLEKIFIQKVAPKLSKKEVETIINSNHKTISLVKETNELVFKESNSKNKMFAKLKQAFDKKNKHSNTDQNLKVETSELAIWPEIHKQIKSDLAKLKKPK